jgi:hypothetical protein
MNLPLYSDQATGWTTGVRFLGGAGKGFFLLLATASEPALWSTQPPIQWLPEALLSRLMRPQREADDSLPCSAEIKNAWSYTSALQTRFHGVLLN